MGVTKYSKFTVDRFLSTGIVFGVMYYSPRSAVPLAFSSAFNLAANKISNSLVNEKKNDQWWNIEQSTADKVTKYFSIFSSISVEYLRPPFQTALSNYVSPKYAAIGGKIGALVFSNIISNIHKDLWLPKDEIKKDEDNEKINNKKIFPIISDASRYLFFLSIREVSDQFLPRVYGIKPFGVIVASCIMYSFYKENETREQFVSKKALDFIYNQAQLKVLVKIPPLTTEKLLRYMLGDVFKGVFKDAIIRPMCSNM